MNISRAHLLAGGTAAALAARLSARPAAAAIAAGAPAPPFSLPATLGTEVFTFDLTARLHAGPVVLYFYPAAFTSGCTVEAHDFADHVEEYKKLGASVLGVSGDGIEKLKRFATSECRSKFAVAADEGLKVAREYDAVLADKYANRTSYVIARNGKIAYAYTSLDPDKHVANTLDAVRKIVKG